MSSCALLCLLLSEFIRTYGAGLMERAPQCEGWGPGWMTENQALGDTFCVSGEASSACWVEYTQGMLDCRREGESKHVYTRFAECVAVKGDFTHWHPQLQLRLNP